MASEFLLPVDRFTSEEIGMDMEFGSIVSHEYNVGSADNEIFWNRGKRFGSGLHIVMDEGMKKLDRFEVAFTELEKKAEQEHLRLLQQLQPRSEEDEQTQQLEEENHISEKEEEDEPTSRLSPKEEEELANKLANMSTNNTFKALIPDPAKFEGSREKFEDWWRSIQLFLTFNKITTDNDKIIACISRMHNGTAGALAALVADRINGNNKISWNKFEKEMIEAFIDGKEKEKSEVAIESLVQGTGTDDQHAVFLLKKNVQKDIIRTILSFPPTNLPTNFTK
ncbi:hypothetical protein AGABI1DRAFT_133434 [Agaricus bisporus var. burnettii JB137-S8]|uniref:Retrotransposon gag domain-containing protein n=1 Tax=Agaricus bisporus var. burnettii (strain JB137-S8 / ATCC MYA-4627 / FGSC 10392) TaxID=597362 RepID=K5VIV5_AGABU|nr:uncharacterized protein AGABI1DRAFT_133434 [Agaricus bisporus var. burnettii JB137-S8]EKM74274.1 hypothetical protein AGABI1DRAFT_133434 [Agaricus bisporus var. burnettii JB137-S8]